jgi:ABC-type transport system substrate-binding protein
MIASTTLNETKHYAREAAELLAFEQPQIVVYNDVVINAYRTYKFEGFFEFKGLGTSSGDNPYVVTQVHLNDSEGGPYGETFRYCLSGNISALNPYLQPTKYESTVFQYIYEKLWNIDPTTWDPIPGLAYDWEIEQTTADGDTRDGQKFTFYLYRNETWHDGEPLTAADVNHSIYMWKSSPRSGREMADIYRVEMPDGPEGHSIELYVNETGYFEWADTTRFYITPEHIWREVSNVSAFNPTDSQIIGTGPYKWNEHVPGEYISLLRHEDWRWDIRDVPNITGVTSEEPTSSSLARSTESTVTWVDDWFTSFEVLPFFVTFILLIPFRKRRDKTRRMNWGRLSGN